MGNRRGASTVATQATGSLTSLYAMRADPEFRTGDYTTSSLIGNRIFGAKFRVGMCQNRGGLTGSDAKEKFRLGISGGV